MKWDKAHLEAQITLQPCVERITLPSPMELIQLLSLLASRLAKALDAETILAKPLNFCLG
ncbi:hypothetical protein ASE86_14560 [Sphingomonas sp. Leaf33]|nr:hypothetical protein ASE86_14560 [Sphingomonas sp. Leaf33]